MAVIVDIKLGPNLFDVGFDLLIWDLFVVEGSYSATLSMLFNAFWHQTHAETFSLSSVKNQLVSQIVNDLEGISLQFFNVEVLNALMLVELSSWILFIADLAHYKDFRAVSLDMIMKLGSSHVLKLWSIADIASKLGAVELSVCLQLTEGFPDELSSFSWASMRKLTEINAIPNNLVNFLEEVTASLAVGAANVEASRGCSLNHLTTLRISSSSISTG